MNAKKQRYKSGLVIHRERTGMAVAGQNAAGIAEICNNKMSRRHKAANCRAPAHCLVRQRERANVQYSLRGFHCRMQLSRHGKNH